MYTNGSNNQSFYIASFGNYSSVRILGSHSNVNSGAIDFTIYGNMGDFVAKGNAGQNGYDIKVYKKDSKIYLFFPTGISVNVILVGGLGKLIQEAIPEGATQLTVSPY